MDNQDLVNYLTLNTAGLSNGAALKQLILTTAQASIQLAELLAKGHLSGESIKLDQLNVQGEHQMQLDVISNDIYIKALKESNVVAGVVSEELTDAVIWHHDAEKHPFLVSFDPLDGSSNLMVNGVIGSIFSILSTPTTDNIDAHAFLQAGKSQVAAFYVIYGPSTMLVLSIGFGTHGFTLDPTTHDFKLTHANLKINVQTNEFAINASNERFWEKPIKRYVAECIDGRAGIRGQDFNMRWMASMVADVHRILMRGGVFLYPKDTKLPSKMGRLRLLYEANPMSMLIEQAGGKSTIGLLRLMEVEPTDIHQRVPVILGSEQEVSLITHYYQVHDQQ